jgi:hypothetical protein
MDATPRPSSRAQSTAIRQVLDSVVELTRPWLLDSAVKLSQFGIEYNSSTRASSSIFPVSGGRLAPPKHEFPKLRIACLCCRDFLTHTCLVHSETVSRFQPLMQMIRSGHGFAPIIYSAAMAHLAREL